MSVKKIKNNVSFMPAIDGVSRKWALRRETCTNKQFRAGSQGINVQGTAYLGCVTKTVPVIGVGPVQRTYLFMRKPMALAPATADQLQVRGYFVSAKAWVDAAMKDLSALTDNQQRFLAAKAEPYRTTKGVAALGYQLMRGWMLAVAYAMLENDEELPANHKLPGFDA